MCEFKILDESNSELAEEIVILSYSEEKKLQLKDILGITKEYDSALIYNVDTLDQTCNIIQHPIVKPFIELIDKIVNKTINENNINEFKLKIDNLKQEL